METALTKPVKAVDDAIAALEQVLQSSNGVPLSQAIASFENPGDQAKLTHNLATCTTALAALYLRLSGVDIRSHRIATELGALKAMSTRLPTERGQPGSGPELKVDAAAATRIVKHHVETAKR